MIYSVIGVEDIFFDFSAFGCSDSLPRSSNPYDYIRRGYYLDNAALFGGKNYVNYKSRNTGCTSSDSLGNTNIRKRS